MSSRIFAMTTVAVAVVFTFLGCGEGEPQFDPSTRYSPASLAQELAFRCKSLDRSAPAVEKLEDVTKGGASTKTKPATKAAQANTLEAVLADVIEKAGKIPGLSQSQACKKVAEEVAKNPEVSDDDKKVIAEKLGRVTD